MLACPTLGPPGPHPAATEAQRDPDLGEMGTEHGWEHKVCSEWETFVGEICSRASLTTLFIFLSKSSH